MDYSKMPIFVFGSNLAGIHGKGAALHAKKYYGAVQGEGIGHRGNSYAIPTKDDALRPLKLQSIEYLIKAFKEYAKDNPKLKFNVTQIGCGLAGFHPDQIAPMFFGSTMNCYFDLQWERYLVHDGSHNYWVGMI